MRLSTPVVGFVFFGIFRLRPAASSVVALEVSPSAPAVALVGRGPLPSSMVSSTVGAVLTVASVGAVVGMVVGAVVGMVVGAVVFIGWEFLHPQPVKMTALRTSTRKSTVYFFIVKPPNLLCS